MELTFAGIVWGFAFVAAKWSLMAFSPVGALMLRFVFAFIFGELIYFTLFKTKSSSETNSHFMETLKLSMPAGLFLGGFMVLQTIGLKYTSSANSGFLTILYVVFVPLLSQLIFKTKPPQGSYWAVILALIGAFFMMGGNFSSFNQGDLFTLGCAFVSSFQIIFVDRISHKIKNPFRFNNFQSFWCFVLLIPLIPIETEPLFRNNIDTEQLNLALWGIAGLVFSSVVAFYLQIRTQKVLDSTTASLLFLMESPNAMLFGFLLLNETINFYQGVGALIIIIAALIVILKPAELKTV